MNQDSSSNLLAQYGRLTEYLSQLEGALSSSDIANESSGTTGKGTVGGGDRRLSELGAFVFNSEKESKEFFSGAKHGNESKIDKNRNLYESLLHSGKKYRRDKPRKKKKMKTYDKFSSTMPNPRSSLKRKRPKYDFSKTIAPKIRQPIPTISKSKSFGNKSKSFLNLAQWGREDSQFSEPTEVAAGETVRDVNFVVTKQIATKEIIPTPSSSRAVIPTSLIEGSTFYTKKKMKKSPQKSGIQIDGWIRRTNAKQKLLVPSETFFSTTTSVKRIPAPKLEQPTKQSSKDFTNETTKEVTKGSAPKLPKQSEKPVHQFLPWSASRDEIAQDFHRESKKAKLYRDISRKTYRQAQGLSIDIQDNMRKAREGLPLTFLFEQKLNEFINERGGQLVIGVFKKLAYHFQHLAIDRWKEFIEERREIERVLSAITIERVFRGFRGRRKAMERRAKYEKMLEEKRFSALLHEFIKRRDVVHIQRVVRGHFGRCQARFLRRQIESAIIVQKRWRIKQSKIIVMILNHAKLRKIISARVIQRFWYRIRGNKILRNQRRKMTRIRREQKLGDRRFIITLKFYEQGASIMIQGWWRKLVREGVLLRTGSEEKKIIRFLGHEFALRIQQRFRIYRSKLILARLQEKKWDREHAKLLEQSAAKIQSMFQAKKARDRVRLIRERAKEHIEELKRRKEAAFAEEVIELKVPETITKVLETTGVANMLHVSESSVLHVNVSNLKRSGIDIVRQLNPMRKRNELKAALAIQCAWRVRQAKRKRKLAWIAHIRHERSRKPNAVTKLASIWRAKKARKRTHEIRREKAVLRIQRCRRHLRDNKILRFFKLYKDSARKMQGAWRSYLAYKELKVLRELRKVQTIPAIKIQCIARIFLSGKRAFKMRQHRRRKAEDAVVGRVNYKMSLKIIEARLLLRATYSGNPKGELFLMYRTYCEMIPSTEYMTESKFLKLLGEGKGIVEKDVNKKKGSKLSRNDISLLFAQFKKGKTLTFRDFVEACVQVASRFFQINEINSYRYLVYLTGEDALLWRLLNERVFVGKSRNATGRIMKAYLQRRTKEHIDIAVRKIQTCFYRKKGRNMRSVLWALRKERELDDKKEKSALILQNLVRRMHARKQVAQLFKNIAKKYIDPDSGAPYWYNPLSGSVTWTKPALLGSDDVDNAVQIADKNIEWSITCANCQEAVCDQYCFHCEEYYCKACYDQVHRKDYFGADALNNTQFCAELPLYTNAMQRRDEKLAKEAEEKANEDARLEREQIEWEKRAYIAAIKLQSIFRMKKAYENNKGLRYNLKVTRLLAKRAVETDEKTKESWEYRLAQLAGRPPVLNTDDEETRAKKLKALQSGPVQALQAAGGNIGGIVKNRVQKQLEKQKERAKLRQEKKQMKDEERKKKEEEYIAEHGHANTLASRVLGGATTAAMQKQSAQRSRWMAGHLKGIAGYFDEEEGIGKWLKKRTDALEKAAEENEKKTLIFEEKQKHFEEEVKKQSAEGKEGKETSNEETNEGKTPEEWSSTAADAVPTSDTYPQTDYEVPYPWQKVEQDGQTYYWNTETNETQYEVPTTPHLQQEEYTYYDSEQGYGSEQVGQDGYETTESYAGYENTVGYDTTEEYQTYYGDGTGHEGSGYQEYQENQEGSEYQNEDGSEYQQEYQDESNWQEYFDEASNQYYLYNESTGETKWK
eukprot:g3607.t1